MGALGMCTGQIVPKTEDPSYLLLKGNRGMLSSPLVGSHAGAALFTI